MLHKNKYFSIRILKIHFSQKKKKKRHRLRIFYLVITSGTILPAYAQTRYRCCKYTAMIAIMVIAGCMGVMERNMA